jgi:hypothetical protein
MARGGLEVMGVVGGVRRQKRRILVCYKERFPTKNWHGRWAKIIENKLFMKRSCML